MENFLQEPEGIIYGLNSKFLLTSLDEDRLYIMGGEDESAVEARRAATERKKTLEAATKIAAETWRKTKQAE